MSGHVTKHGSALADTIQDTRRRTQKVPCIVCGRRTIAQSGICAAHPDGGVTGDLYQRLREQCCDTSGLTAEQLDEHAYNVARVVSEATALEATRTPPDNAAVGSSRVASSADGSSLRGHTSNLEPSTGFPVPGAEPAPSGSSSAAALTNQRAGG